jgi:hypothetical protein
MGEKPSPDGRRQSRSTDALLMTPRVSSTSAALAYPRWGCNGTAQSPSATACSRSGSQVSACPSTVQVGRWWPCGEVVAFPASAECL